MRHISDRDKGKLKAVLKELLIYERKSIKEAAALLDISERTVFRWIDDPKDGFRQEFEKAKIKGAGKRNTENIPSPALEAKVRVNRPDLIPILNEMLDLFRKPNLNNI